jgi:hypothetical protein
MIFPTAPVGRFRRRFSPRIKIIQISSGSRMALPLPKLSVAAEQTFGRLAHLCSFSPEHLNNKERGFHQFNA